MCESQTPSAWDIGGLPKSISPINKTIDNAVDKVLDINFYKLTELA
jgi:hypothetical protein